MLLVLRHPPTDEAILSEVLVDGAFECVGLESTVYAIPAGTYKVTITPSERFGRLLPLIHVPGRSGIRVHPGNFTGDTTGCLLVGESHATVTISKSRVAMEALQRKLAKALAEHEPVWITMQDAAAQPLKA